MLIGGIRPIEDRKAIEQRYIQPSSHVILINEIRVVARKILDFPEMFEQALTTVFR